MNILYLEDSPLDIELLTRYMRIISATFLVERTIDGAQRCLLDRSIDIFLVDIVIGDQLTFPLIRMVVEQKLSRYVVAVTARVLPWECRQYLKMGCDAVLAKPYTIDDLENTLRLLGVKNK